MHRRHAQRNVQITHRHPRFEWRLDVSDFAQAAFAIVAANAQALHQVTGAIPQDRIQRTTCRAEVGGVECSNARRWLERLVPVVRRRTRGGCQGIVRHDIGRCINRRRHGAGNGQVGDLATLARQADEGVVRHALGAGLSQLRLALLAVLNRQRLAQQCSGFVVFAQPLIDARSRGEDLGVARLQGQRLFTGAFRQATITALQGDIRQAQLQASVVRVLLNQRRIKLHGLFAIAAGRVHPRQGTYRHSVVGTLGKRRRQHVVGRDQVVFLTQGISLFDPVQVDQIVVTLATGFTQRLALHFTQDVARLGVMVSLEQHVGVQQFLVDGRVRIVIQNLLHDIQALLRRADFHISGRQHRQALRLLPGHGFTAAQQREGFRALATAGGLDGDVGLLVQRDIDTQLVHVSGTLPRRDTRQGLFSLFPLTQLRRQQRAGVQRVRLVRLLGQQAVDQGTGVANLAVAQVNARQGEACPRVFRVGIKGLFVGGLRGFQIAPLLGQLAHLGSAQRGDFHTRRELRALGGRHRVDQLQGFFRLPGLGQHVDQAAQRVRVARMTGEHFAVAGFGGVELIVLGLETRQCHGSAGLARVQAFGLGHQVAGLAAAPATLGVTGLVEQVPVAHIIERRLPCRATRQTGGLNQVAFSLAEALLLLPQHAHAAEGIDVIGFFIEARRQ